MGVNSEHCTVCVVAEWKAKHVTRHKALSELSTNTVGAKKNGQSSTQRVDMAVRIVIFIYVIIRGVG